jgi:hypothetical protein
VVFLPVFFSSLAFAFSAAFAATTIYVPADKPTMQAGIDAAVHGDTALFADRTCTGEGDRNIDFKTIWLDGLNGECGCLKKGTWKY